MLQYFERHTKAGTEFGATEYCIVFKKRIYMYAAETEYIHLVKPGVRGRRVFGASRREISSKLLQSAPKTPRISVP